MYGMPERLRQMLPAPLREAKSIPAVIVEQLRKKKFRQQDILQRLQNLQKRHLVNQKDIQVIFIVRTVEN